MNLEEGIFLNSLKSTIVRPKIEGDESELSHIYVTERKTYQVKDQQSRPRKVDCGVPQGSVLGPQNSSLTPEILAELIEE